MKARVYFLQLLPFLHFPVKVISQAFYKLIDETNKYLLISQVRLPYTANDNNNSAFPFHTLTHSHTQNANSLATARRSRAPGRARMPMH